MVYSKCSYTSGSISCYNIIFPVKGHLCDGVVCMICIWSKDTAMHSKVAIRATKK